MDEKSTELLERMSTYIMLPIGLCFIIIQPGFVWTQSMDMVSVELQNISLNVQCQAGHVVDTLKNGKLESRLL